eukprot:jgi/Botrbrau1/3671/Bobra.0008s0005.1
MRLTLEAACHRTVGFGMTFHLACRRSSVTSFGVDVGKHGIVKSDIGLLPYNVSNIQTNWMHPSGGSQHSPDLQKRPFSTARIPDRYGSIKTRRFLAVRSSSGNSIESSSNGDKDSSYQGAEADNASTSFSMKGLVVETWRLMMRKFSFVVLVFAVSDVLMFFINRISHRAVNEVAMKMISGLTPEMIGKLWYLSSNPDVANFQTGYQFLVIFFFIIGFPLILLIRSAAFAAASVMCAQADDEGSSTVKGWRQSSAHLWGDLRAAASEVHPILGSVWQTYMLSTLWALPFQALSLILLPAPWALPRLLRLQLSLPVAIFEKSAGIAAVQRSGQLLRPVQWKFALPWLALVVGARLVSYVKDVFVQVVPSMAPRLMTEVPELPMAAYLLLVVIAVLASRVRDLLPVAAYLQLTRPSGILLSPPRDSPPEKPGS